MSGFPSHVWRKCVCALPISAAHKVVLIRLAEYADYETGRDAWPGRSRLAEDCRVSPSAVDRAVKAGKRHGVIRQTAGGHRGANPVFCLAMPEESASLLTRYAGKRVTGDKESASLLTRLPTPIPTPTNEKRVTTDALSLAPSSSDLDRSSSSYSSAPMGASEASVFGITADDLGLTPPQDEHSDAGFCRACCAEPCREAVRRERERAAELARSLRGDAPW